MATGSSYDFNNTIRDVSTIFELLLEDSKNSLLNVIGGLTGTQEVTNPKYEWVEDTLAPKGGTLNADSNSGSGTIVLNGELTIRDESVLRFTSDSNVSKTVFAKVISSVVGVGITTLTVTRPYAGSTDENLLTDDKWYLVSVPQQQGSEAGDGEIYQGYLPYNYTQIFDIIAEVTKTANATLSYDKATLMATQEAKAMQNLMFDIENTLIYGRKVVASNGVGGAMGGILQFLTDAGSVDTTGGSISATLINNNIEEILNKGAFSNRMLLLASPNQARKISAFATTGVNPVMQRQDNEDLRIGNYVSRFVGDIPVQGGNLLNIFANWRMPKDQVAIIDLDRIMFKVMRSMQKMDATPKGSDSMKSRVLTEITLEVKNAGQAHRLLTGLSV